jgi:filamentous hemagglutinin family protein
MTAIAALLIAQRAALGGPIGGSVVEGSAGISQSGSVTNINQSTNKAIINWQGFSIGANETVNFNQPGSSSVTLNRVIGNETSVISGALNANGQVFIVNSAGVLFSKNAQVNVGGLVASTLDISNANFMAGNYTFSGNSSASIVNQGTIRAHGGGYVALLGNTVSNDGVISAKLGTVAMAAGSQITLNFGGNSLLDVTIDRGTFNALVENKRAIVANGGQVIMTAKAADSVLSAQVNNSGVIQARSMAALTGGSGKTRAARTGSIKLIADGGTTTVSGRLDASAPKGGNGGTIETSGNKVKIADGAVITTKAAEGKSGTWTIDPDGFTVAASGGDMTGAALSNWLATNGVVIIASTNGHGTDGNININDAVSWSTNSILTLTATNNININAPITSIGNSAGLVMNYGGFAANGVAATGTNYNINMATHGSVTLTGTDATLQINGVNYTLIHTMDQLAALSSNPAIPASGHYALAQNLAPGSDPTSNYQFSSSVIGTLSGTLAGLGHTISNLTINNTTLASNTGLIGTARAGSTIRDLGLIGATVTETKTANTSNSGVGVLVGVSSANVSNVYVDSTSRVSSAMVTGGLIGIATGPVTISDASSGAAVASTTSNTGGLIGKATNVNVVRSHATGDVTGTTSNGGGLIGLAANVNITDSYATGNVTGTAGSNGLGGLVGNASSSAGAVAIVNSFASGNVRGGDGLGGLVGVLAANLGDFTIQNSHATGDVSSVGATVSSPSGIGGLVGFTTGDPGRKITIENAYATGAVGFFAADGVTPAAAGNNAGGLVGTAPGTGITMSIDNSHATGKVTGSLTGSGVGGLVGTGGDRSDTISNSYATGDVSGNVNVGGLAGSNEGAITNSYATGNVTGYNSTSSNSIGGLVGTNTLTGTITNSHADGNVNGQGTNAATGGLVGSNAGSIADSYAAGTVTGPPGLTGGIAGVSFNNSGDPNNTTAGGISNSWFNSDKNPGLSMTNTPACCQPGVVTGGGGLTTTQFADIKFYLNGTINQVLADRAAAAAAKAAAEAAAKAAAAQTAQAASRTADKVASNAATSASTASDPALSAAGTSAAVAKIDESIKNIKDSVNADDQRARRRVTAAAASATRRSHGGGSDLGATIRSIDVDGQRFDLQNGKKDVPGQKP